MIIVAYRSVRDDEKKVLYMIPAKHLLVKWNWKHALHILTFTDLSPDCDVGKSVHRWMQHL